MVAVDNNLNSKQLYSAFCDEEEGVAVFSLPWWLDAACGSENWDVVLAAKKNRIVGSLPFFVKKKAGLKLISMPNLTQTLGPFLSYPAKQTKQKRLAYEKDMFQLLVDQLPSHSQFTQNFSPRVTNWLPFYWKGFSQTTKYTYRLDGIKSHESLWKGLSGNIRTDIRKGEKSIRVVESNSSSDLYSLVCKTFARQGKSRPTYSSEFQANMINACRRNNACSILLGIDEQGRHHAGALIVWDRECAYYLVGGGDPELRNSGATSLVLWEAIKRASMVVDKFDFEGSMLEPVERFFRAFGGEQVPIHRVSKTSSRLLRASTIFKSMIKGA